MKRIFAFLFCVAAAPCFGAGELPAVEVVNVAALQRASFGAYIHLQGLVTPGDGNDAYYTQNGLTCSPDGFSIIKDGAGHCYFRGITPSQSVPVFASVASVQALGTSAPAVPEVQTTSYLAGIGKGAARYTWNGSSTVNDCAHIAVTGVATGRYVLRADLQNNYILPTQCGAYFDSSVDGSTGHDDSGAWNAAYVAAFAAGYIIGPVPGITRLTHVVTTQPGVIFQGAGMGVETLQCHDNFSDTACLYRQNPVGVATYEAPKFYDFTIAGSFGVVLIQFNCASTSPPCGFTDTSTTQGYMRGPIIERVSTPGLASTAFQCSKCFQGHFSYNSIASTFSVAIDIQGSDFMEISHNQITNSGGRSIQIVQQGTFGNFDVVAHNDTSRPRIAGDSYIYSNARSAEISFNGMENIPGTDPITSCMIKLDGGFTVTVEQNQYGAIDSPNSICVNGDQWFSLDIHDNNVATGTGPAPVFNSGSGLPIWINNNSRTNLTHKGNRQGSDIYFPFNSLETNLPLAANNYAVWTPSTSDNVTASDYGAIVRANNNAYILPPLTGTTGLIRFPVLSVAGTLNICLRSQSSNGSTLLNVQILAGGTPVLTTTITPSVAPNVGWNCFSQAVGPDLQVFVWNNDTTHGGTISLFEVAVRL